MDGFNPAMDYQNQGQPNPNQQYYQNQGQPNMQMNPNQQYYQNQGQPNMQMNPNQQYYQNQGQPNMQMNPNQQYYQIQGQPNIQMDPNSAYNNPMANQHPQGAGKPLSNPNCIYCRGTGFMPTGKKKAKKCKSCSNPWYHKTWCGCLKYNKYGKRKCKINKNTCDIL